MNHKRLRKIFANFFSALGDGINEVCDIICKNWEWYVLLNFSLNSLNVINCQKIFLKQISPDASICHEK